MRSGLLAMLIGAWLAPAAALAFDEAIPVEPGGSLAVDVDLGEGLRPDPGFLELASHDVDEIRVVGDADGWASWAVSFTLDAGGPTVRLDVRVEGATSWMFGGPRVRVRVWVPRDFSVDIRSKSGPVRIQDIGGRVRARARDAGVEIRGVSGPVKLRVVNGPVEIEEITGDLEVTSSDGSIQIAWVTGDVEARTTAGEIEMSHIDGEVTAKTLGGSIELAQVRGPVVARTEHGSVRASFSSAPAGSLETERGSVDVVIPTDSATDLDAHATRGSVVVDSAIGLNGEEAENQVVGSINGGGELLLLRTSRGRIHVGRR
jgi:hypothetical protein